MPSFPEVVTATFTQSATGGKVPIRIEFTNTGNTIDYIVESGSADHTGTEDGAATDVITES